MSNNLPSVTYSTSTRQSARPLASLQQQQQQQQKPQKHHRRHDVNQKDGYGLLMLYYSQKCSPDEIDSRDSYCADMKRFWKHVARCKKTHSKDPLCYLSSSILSHHHGL